MGLFDFFRRKKEKPVEQKPEVTKHKTEQPLEKRSDKPAEQKKVEQPFQKRKPRPYHSRRNKQVTSGQPSQQGQPNAGTHGSKPATGPSQRPAQKHYSNHRSSGTAQRNYTVKAGDSLSRIAKQFYGNANDWQKIYQANKNRIKDPNIIHPGQVLVIP